MRCEPFNIMGRALPDGRALSYSQKASLHAARADNQLIAKYIKECCYGKHEKGKYACRDEIQD